MSECLAKHDLPVLTSAVDLDFIPVDFYQIPKSKEFINGDEGSYWGREKQIEGLTKSGMVISRNV